MNCLPCCLKCEFMITGLVILLFAREVRGLGSKSLFSSMNIICLYPIPYSLVRHNRMTTYSDNEGLVALLRRFGLCTGQSRV